MPVRLSFFYIFFLSCTLKHDNCNRIKRNRIHSWLVLSSLENRIMFLNIQKELSSETFICLTAGRVETLGGIVQLAISAIREFRSSRITFDRSSPYSIAAIIEALVGRLTAVLSSHTIRSYPTVHPPLFFISRASKAVRKTNQQVTLHHQQGNLVWMALRINC